MRLHHALRAPSALGLAWALGIAIILAAAAPATAKADTTTGVRAAVEDRSLRAGQDVIVRGRVAGAGSGVPIALQTRPAGTGRWITVKRKKTGRKGRYRIGASIYRSGRVRVVALGAAPRSAAASPPASAGRRVRVRARLFTKGVRRHVVVGRRPAKVAGAVRPGGAGRVVKLQLRRNGRWRTVDVDRTSRSGRFALRERFGATGTAPARLRFRGDRRNAPSTRSIGRLNGYRYAHASWYGPGLYGNPLGCGGRLYPGTVGVAHKTLPCGTRITLRHRGNVVQTRVIDRGPYVAGREFDLTAAAKSRLGFVGVGSIQVAH